MGSFFAKALKPLTSRKQMSIVMVGLDYAGKTTILYKLKLGEVVMTIPTIGMNVEVVEYKNVKFHTWDIGGKDKIKPLWRHYFQDANGLILVVASNKSDDRIVFNAGLNSLKHDFDWILNDEKAPLVGVPLLIFANKQDLPDAMDLFTIAGKLGAASYKQDWFMHATCALTGDGLYEGLDWLSNKCNRKEYAPDPAGKYTTWINNETYRLLLENCKKSILFVCGWMRKQNEKSALQIPANVLQCIHQFYQDKDVDHDNSYSYNI